MRNHSFEQAMFQPYSYKENTYRHEPADTWSENIIESCFQPIIGSFYVPRSDRSIFARGGTAL